MNRIQPPPQQKQKEKAKNQKQKKMLIANFEQAMMRRVSFLLFLLCIIKFFKNQNADSKNALKVNIMSTTSYSVSNDTAPVPSPLRPGSYPNAGNLNKAASFIFSWYTMFTATHTRVWKLRVPFGPWFGPFSMITSLRVLMYTIKEMRKEICTGLVSCAKVLALVVREGVVLAGGPFYPLYTGRRDSRLAFADIATFELPSPKADLPETLATFASTGFDLREFMTLLGACSIAVLHYCKLFNNCLNLLTSKCRNISSTMPIPSGSASDVDFPSSSADFDGSDFTSLARSVSFFTLIAKICAAFIAVIYLIPSIGVIWYTSGSGVSSNGASGSGLIPGSNGIIGKKRDRSPNYRGWESYQPPQKEYRLEHPRMFLNDQPEEGKLFDISIKAVLLECNRLSPEDPLVNSVFYYPLEADCARCGYGIHQPMHWSTNRDFNSNCGACGCHISIQLEERGEGAFTSQAVAADRWVRIVSFRSWNLRNFKYIMAGGTWRVRKPDSAEHTFMLTEEHRMFVPANMLAEVNSFFYHYQVNDPHSFVLIFGVYALRAIITERVEEIGGLEEIGGRAARAA